MIELKVFAFSGLWLASRRSDGILRAQRYIVKR
jgi:hypothetical protein